ncbi:ARID DNA-binding domain-containing protein [Tanacetum coccineum]|uniref:ARID DNA-binding domain-containing protein n=1 Tax=Tanacetum coccineum TaxID=301880 RepID=A0ABQ5AJA1_9ASTR
MYNPNSHSIKWPKLHRSTYGLDNKWHQSKTWDHLRKRQHLDFIQRQLKRENQEQIGSCMKKISEECKSMLKNKMKEVIQYNSSLKQPTSNDRYKNYKCFQCKQLGHIVKYCPIDYKVENMDTKKDAKRRMEGIKTTKPTVMITYPETIHFSTTCMIKDTELTSWDEIWYVSNQIDRHVCYKLDAFCNIKEGFSVTKLENQKKFLFTYGMGEVLIEEGGKGLIVPGVFYAPEVTLNILSLELLEKQGFEVGYDGNRCTLSLMFKDKKVQNFDEDRMRKMQTISS